MMLRTTIAITIATLFGAAPAFACETITSERVKLSSCIDSTTWALQDPQGVQEYLYYSTDNAVGFALITEAETVALSAFRNAILGNAVGAAAEGNPENVAIVSERVETIAGRAWNVIEYEVNTGEQQIRFQNFYYVQPGFGSTQFVYWSEPDGATAAAYRAGQMLATVAFVE